MKRNDVKCSFKPAGLYFFGGEKIFDFEGLNSYYITSQKEPPQSTILGALRFMVLKKAGCLSPEKEATSDELRKKQEDLIGKNESVMTLESLGKIREISPVYIFENNRLLIKTPFNHVTSYSDEEIYTPFKMKSNFVSEKGDTILPVNYNAKNGLTDSYMDIANQKVFRSDRIFDYKEQTHIARKRDSEGKLVLKEKAYFKKNYCLFKNKDYSFACYVNCEDGILPENDIIFLGQEKSPFYFTSERCDENEPSSITFKIERLYQPENGYRTYYVASDVYINNSVEMNRLLSFSIIKKKTYRFLTDLRNGENFKKRIIKSKILYQFIEAGSILFVKEENGFDFMELINENSNLKISGFNHIVELKKYEENKK